MIDRFECLRQGFVAGILLLLLVVPNAVQADEFRPALLEINERDGGWVDFTWKVPMRGDKVLALTPVLPEFLEQMGPGSARRVPGAWLETRSYRAGQQTLNGVTLSIEGLDAVPADVLVRVRLRDDTEHSAILRSGSSSFTIPEQATRMNLAISYWRMGTIHILEGYDHLLFLLTLLLIVSGIWPLLKTVTAFTLAHSLTLALATLGLLYIPPVPTEAVISLSIVLLAVEVVRKNQGQLTLSERYPWFVAFTFGLVHGLGFAGALSEIGVPPNEVPLALLMFNVGVETGQVMFVVVVSMLLAGLHRLHGHSAFVLARATPYAIGGVAMFWTIQRIGLFLPL
ncbi:MAG: HupE/UreJ family protein [Gammaproteobacteria bacterium]|nr:MAG: HupE/UreJ family protein [Gammaproteobacteria bacterium]